MKTIIEHLTPFTERIPPEGTDLFVCEEKDTERRYGIMRFFRKGTLLPGSCCGGKTPEERLLEQIFHETSRGNMPLQQDSTRRRDAPAAAGGNG